ncbi:hypothetical protein BEN47_09980 [Hymenobacter lapidarius]|uniref:DUF1156 domain-containing protein n=1 Tax=Hymenobacter lapidarius TaxID=1908237 RepID=A0A1G1TB17_9BACT|nr:DUF1156 domain-containing protein [Hymenobacter lapidarius]OGX88066.1 hypothetical protein BEN47_09980 [Hymenobacter lapidarius]
MSSPTYKKLIEVAMPVKEVSAESVRDKSIRHGHISTLHLWWARRPLPVCRAVVFASLVPDPDDGLAPPAFRAAVSLLLGAAAGLPTDPYRPYDDIPYTAAVDRMADTPRNRLLMFVGKFSDKFAENEKAGRKTASKEQLSAHSLIRWESKNDPIIIGRARRLIWVAHNASAAPEAGTAAPRAVSAELTTLLADYGRHDQAIRAAEQALYALPDRHEASPEAARLEAALHQAIEAFLDRMPRVFDPFAGGGAIPLEAARLGCRAFGNDINPVAHIIQRGSLEFPQRFGKPITYSRAAFVARYGEAEYTRQHARQELFATDPDRIRVPNRLAFDVDFYARQLLARAEAEIGQYYPADAKGRKPIAYYWARVGTCANPSCRAEVPLLRQFYLVNRPGKQVYLEPIISGTQIDFQVKNGYYETEGWVRDRKSLKCPCCGSTTASSELKRQFLAGPVPERLLAVVDGTDEGRAYRVPTSAELGAAANVPMPTLYLEEKLPHENTKQFDVCPWGYLEYGQLFSKRQLFTLQTLLAALDGLKVELNAAQSDYAQAVVTYLGILMDRLAILNTAFGIWHTGRETLERPMGRQAFAMVFDYPESNPFCDSTGSAANQLDWITRFIVEESQTPFSTLCHNASSGDNSQFAAKYLNAVVTDPPYYDAIPYADLSDFFYGWMKRTLGDVHPLNFAFPQTPKTEECTAMKYRHGGAPKAKKHFENKLQQIFVAIEHQTSDVVSIMFAHQSTEAWTTLCNSILGASMNITGSWANDTEMTGALKADKAFLASSVTVACRPSQRRGEGHYKQVKEEIEATVAREVEELYRLGFRGVDLLTACFGQAVSVFGQYAQVEKSDGTTVTVADLLTLARESAFKALLKNFEGDDYTKFYIGWLQLYGFVETDFDDAATFSKMGLSINVADLLANRIFLKNGNKLTLASATERLAASRHLGEDAADLLLDQAHRALSLYRRGQRDPLLRHLARVGGSAEMPFWRVLTALGEVLPAGSDDRLQTTGLLADRDSLLRESKQLSQKPAVLATGDLFAE